MTDSEQSNILTLNQRRLLSDVADIPRAVLRDGGGYGTRDGNEDRTMRSLRRRGLVAAVPGCGVWRLTERGEDLIAAWDARGCM